jgi:hypothetical protein
VPRTFVVERFWPGVTLGQLEAALERAAIVGGALDDEGRHVTHAHCTLIPEDETVVCVFEAETAQDVAELNRRAEFSFDRIAEAVSLTGRG